MFGVHPSQSKDDLAVPLASQILGCIEGFLQCDAEAALEQHRKLSLATDGLQQFKVLGIACPNLKHHTGGMAGLLQRFAYIFDMGIVQNLHGDDLDPVLAGQLEDPGETVGAVTLEGIRAGSWFVGSHAGADLSRVAAGLASSAPHAQAYLRHTIRRRHAGCAD